MRMAHTNDLNSKKPRSRTAFSRPELAAAVLTFVLGVILTVGLWALSRADARANTDRQLASRAQDIAGAIRARLTDYEELLRGAAALFASSGNIDRKKWRAFTQALRIENRYPGIESIGYAEHVSAANKGRHEERARRQGAPSYAIMPAGQRDDYAPVIVVEAFGDGDSRPPGFDVLSEPTRRAAAMRARDSAEPAVSGKVVLAPQGAEKGQNPAARFLIYLPVYRRNLPVVTVEQRRSALAGYVYGAFRIDRMVDEIANQGIASLGLEIFDGNEIADGARMYPGPPDEAAKSQSPPVSATSRLDVDGRTWTLRLSSLPPLPGGGQLIAGLVVSALLAELAWLIAVNRSRLLGHRLFKPRPGNSRARPRTILDRSAEAPGDVQQPTTHWNPMFGRADSGMAIISDGRLQAVNARFAEMHGYAVNELLGQPTIMVAAPETVADLKMQDSMALEKGRHTFESMHINKDGTRFTALVDMAAIKNDAGELVYYTVDVEDVDGRKLIRQRLVESTQSLKLVMDSARIGTWELDFESGDVLNSLVLYRIFGYGDALPNWNYDLFLQHVHPDERESVNAGFERAMKGVDSWDFECRIVRADRREGWIWGRGNLKRGHTGEAARLIILIGDITDRRQAENEVRRLNAELEQRVSQRTAQFEAANRQIERDYSNIRLLSEMSSEMQSCATSKEAFDVIRRYCAQLFSGQTGALYLMHESRKYLSCAVSWGDGIFDFLPPDQCWALRRCQVHPAPNGATDPACEHVRVRHHSPPACLCIPMTAHNEILGLLHVEFMPSVNAGPVAAVDRQFIIALSEQISAALANLRLRESLREQSIRDPLTGLFNRRYMQEAFRQEISRAERKGIPLAIVMLDVDHFKRLNDQFGHDAGDTVLTRIGELLQSQIRNADIACRFGGEEFVLLLYESPLEAARQRAEKIRHAVRNLQLIHKTTSLGQLTISLGIAAFPEHGATVAALLDLADVALYAAKHAGRDRVVVSGGNAQREFKVSAPGAASGG